MTDRPGLDFSFSGLNLSGAHHHLELATDGVLAEQDKADIAACFQAAVVDTLVLKCQRAQTRAGEAPDYCRWRGGE